jgi:hypothetical protein
MAGNVLFMVWILLVWGNFLIEACNPAIIALFTATHKMNVCQSITQIPIYNAAFMKTKHKKVGISHYIL